MKPARITYKRSIYQNRSIPARYSELENRERVTLYRIENATRDTQPESEYRVTAHIHTCKYHEILIYNSRLLRHASVSISRETFASIRAVASGTLTSR